MERKLDPKAAISKAKAIVLDMFAGESPQDVGLEEIRYDEESGLWVVIIGFSRPWDAPINRHSVVRTGFSDLFPRRSYKIVRISDETGEWLSLTEYDFENKKQ